jgi:thiosulfate/3-mercaptopyruvate sulfurtransferase
MVRSDSLVTVEWLSQNLDDPNVRLVDVRWFLPSTGRSGLAEFRLGHLPGATFVDLDRELAGQIGRYGGRHPLPDPEEFASVLEVHGIQSTTHVVGYDDSAGSTAARLWWMLRQIGHERVSILDGGLSAWRAAGLALELGDAPCPSRTSYMAAQYGAFGGIVSCDDVLPALNGGALLFDARNLERFEGTYEPIDPRAGHIPGARSLPFLGNVTQAPNGSLMFLPTDALRVRFVNAGATSGVPVILSCGSGVTACHNALAMYLAGFDPPSVYVGSWSDWSSRLELPVEVGANVHKEG